MIGKYREDGFTLIEMLVVLAILAATLAVSLPYVKSSGDGLELEAVAQTVAARLQQTHATAVQTNSEQMFKVDLQHGVLLEPNYQLPNQTILQIETAAGFVDQNIGAIRFFADGGSTGGKIILTKNKQHFEIAINWLDGAVVLSKSENP